MNLTEIYAAQAEERSKNPFDDILEQFGEYFEFMRDTIHHAAMGRMSAFSIISGVPVHFDSPSDVQQPEEENEGITGGVLVRGLTLSDLIIDDPWPTPDHLYSGAFGPSHALAYSSMSELERIQKLLEYQEAPAEYFGEVKDLFKRSWRRRDQDDAIDLFNAEDLRRRVRNTPLLDIHHTSGHAARRTGYPKEKERMMFL